MKGSDSLEESLRRSYPPEKVELLLRRLPQENIVGSKTVTAGLEAHVPSYHFVIREPDGGVRTEVLGIGVHIIGRLSSCHIVLRNEAVSRVHCAVTVDSNGSVALCDLDSHNRTVVNEQVLVWDEKRVLQIGDQIKLATTTLTLVKA